MKKGNIFKFCLPLLLLTLMTTGCKTTEKNYKSAYDVAIQKKKAEKAADEELGIPQGMLHQMEGPDRKTVDGSEVFVERKRLKRFDDDSLLRGKYCVVIGAYKMKTNCRAQVADLQAKGYPAFMAADSSGKYYVVVSEFPKLEEAASFAKSYVEKEKPTNYVGYDDGPV
ncbi:MAG: SPOR domain-containing protein, partial [Muribaculaceae bacterium]|nr:SPOR domain-containing protein [Muribaculaceae bacterium]